MKKPSTSLFVLSVLLPFSTPAVSHVIDCGDEPVPKYSIELVHLQDLTFSYYDRLPDMKKNLPNLVSELNNNFESMRLALSSFGDKPIRPFGSSADYCYKQHVPMTTSERKFTKALQEMWPTDGVDLPESQFSALQHALLSEKTGWSTSPVDKHGLPILRVAVVGTDATAHMAVEDEKKYRFEFSDFYNVHEKESSFFSWSSKHLYRNNGDAILDCKNEDYPSIDQVGRALKEKGVLPVIISSKGEPRRFWEEIISIWADKFDVYGVLTEVDSEWKELVEKIMESLEEIVCRTTTTTEEPTTTTITETTTSTTTSTVTTTSTETTTSTTTSTVTTTSTETTTSTTTSTMTTTSTTTTTTTTAACLRYSADFLLVQDITYSYKNDLPNLRKIMPHVVEDFKKEFILPRFGLASFADVPRHPFGSKKSGDYTYRLHTSLDIESDEFLVALSQLKTRSGLDWKESQLIAMQSAAVQEESGWRGIVEDSGFPVLRIVALATDAGYHTKADSEEFPLVEEVVESFAKAGVSPLFLVTGDVVPLYEELADRFSEAGITAAVATLRDDSADIAESLKNGLEDLCGRETKRRLEA